MTDILTMKRVVVGPGSTGATVVPILVATRNPADFIDTRQALYGAPYRNTAGRAWLAGNTLGVSALYQPAVPTRNFVLRGVQIAIIGSTAVTMLGISLRTRTVAPTGGAAGTGRSFSPNGPAATALIMNDFTSAVSVSIANAADMAIGITGAASVINPPPPLEYVDMYPIQQDPTEWPPPISGLVAGRGWELAINSTVGSTLQYSLKWFWAEADSGY